MHLSYAKAMVAEEPQAGSLAQLVSMSILDTLVWGPGGRSVHSLVFDAPAATHTAVSRSHGTLAIGALPSPFVLLPMLCAPNLSNVLEVRSMCVHSGMSLQYTAPSTSHQAHQR